MTTTPAPLCALYCRVSTDDQTCALQLDELRSYCDRRGWRIYGEYVDTGWSGTKADRPQLSKLLKDARMHRFDCVMVWKIDRFGRSVRNFVEHLEELESYGVRFMVTSQAIDTDQSSPGSRLLMCILAAVAEFERSMIQERVKAGLNAARRRGVRLGRPKAVIDRQKVLELHLRGKSVRQIAQAMHSNLGTIHRMLRDKPAA